LCGFGPVFFIVKKVKEKDGERTGDGEDIDHIPFGRFVASFRRGKLMYHIGEYLGGITESGKPEIDKNRARNE
jgi:hypothetical protein